MPDLAIIYIYFFFTNESKLGTEVNVDLTPFPPSFWRGEIRTHDITIVSRVYKPQDRTFCPYFWKYVHNVQFLPSGSVLTMLSVSNTNHCKDNNDYDHGWPGFSFFQKISFLEFWGLKIELCIFILGSIWQHFGIINQIQKILAYNEFTFKM